MPKKKRKNTVKQGELTFRGQPVRIGSIIPGLYPSAFCEENDGKGKRELYGKGRYTITARIMYIHPEQRFLTVQFDIATKAGTVVGQIKQSYCIRGGIVWEG